MHDWAQQSVNGHHDTKNKGHAIAGKGVEGATVRLRSSRLGAGRTRGELGRAVRLEAGPARPLPQPVHRQGDNTQPQQVHRQSGCEVGSRPRQDEERGRITGTQSGVDLRLRLRRQAAETIVQRAQLLNAADRGLLEAVFSSGHSVQQVGRHMGVVSPNRLRRLRARVRQLVARVGDPQFVFVSEAKSTWPAARREVAELCIMQGVSMRDAARRMGVSLYTVRQHRQRIETLYEASLAMRSANRGMGEKLAGALQTHGGGS